MCIYIHNIERFTYATAMQRIHVGISPATRLRAEQKKQKVKFPAETVILVGGIYALKPSKDPPNKM